MTAQALAVGTRIADIVEIVGGGVQAPAAIVYQGRRLADGAAVDVVESWPPGAERDASGACLPGTLAPEIFAQAQAAFAARVAALDGLAARGLATAFERVAANQTLYALAPRDETSTLDSWSTDLLRRVTPDELAQIVRRLVDGLQAAHETGLCHNAISQETIRLDTPADAHLADFLLAPTTGASEQADMLALAAALYVVVTGRPPPQPQEGFLPDPRHAASHIAADDYPPALLVAIDGALGLGGMPKAQDPATWLTKLRAAATEPEAAAAAPSASTSGEGARSKTGRSPARPAPAITAVDASVPATATGRKHLGLIAASVVLLAVAMGGVGYWTMTPRGIGSSTTEPRVEAQAPRPDAAAPAPSPPSSPEPQPGVAPSSAISAVVPPVPPAQPPVRPEQVVQPAPEPTVPPTVVPAAPAASPATTPDLATQVAAATDRESLIALQATGADPQRVAARLEALGYVALSVGGERRWLMPGGAEIFRDCADCPELVLAPAGQVQMTLAIGAALRTFAAPLPHAFAIGRHEVTRAQFRAFVARSSYVPSAGCHARAPNWRLNPVLSWDAPGFAQTENDPVVCINLEDARAYLVWLSRTTGQRYRLPTDPEWHYVALRQADSATLPNKLCSIGNGADETAREVNPGWTVAPCRDGYVHTAPVGRFAASDWGLTDLNGNAWEWVDTCPPGRDDTVFPPPLCPLDAPRILRGGSFSDPPAMRLLDARIVSQPEIRDQVAGFRVLRDLQP